jgi:hypothetical protein
MAQVKVNSRVAFGFYRQPDKSHSRLPGRSASFFGITIGTGTDKIFPCRPSAHTSRYNMVEGQFACREFFSAVLAFVAVAGKNVAPVEFDIVSRQTVIEQQSDDSGYGYVKINCSNPVMFVWLKGPFYLANISPAFEIVVVILALLVRYDFCQFPAQHAHRSFDVYDAQRHIMLV